jgi:O-antigen/teichoic acid export membrane protein
MSRIRSALFFTVLAQQSVQVINLVSVVVLARLLTPSEVGVYALASSVALLAIELRSLGVGQYLIREKTIDEEKIRSAIGVMIMISWGLGAMIVISAPFIKDFYGEPALTSLLWIISVGFVLAPFTSVPHALLAREMKFQQLFYVKFLSSFSLTASTIILVLLGYSYYGLALGIMIGSTVEFLTINYFAPKGTPWKPSFTGTRKLIRFGLFISLSQLFTRFSESISDLVIGRAGTMTEVGLFSRGLGLILFLNKIIVIAAGPVILPYLSEVRRAGNSVGEAYLRVIVLQSAFSLPVFAVVNVAAFPIIRVMFGDQWDIAIPIASILAIWGMFQAIHSFSNTALISTGTERTLFYASLTVFIARLILVITAAFAIKPFSLVAVAWALVASGFIELIIKTAAVKLGIGLSVFRFCIAFIPNLIITAACWTTLTLINRFMPFEQTSPWISVAVIAGSMSIVWLIMLWATKHPLWKIITNILLEIVKKKKAS